MLVLSEHTNQQAVSLNRRHLITCAALLLSLSLTTSPMVRHSAQDPPAGGSGSGGGGGRKPRKPSDKPRASWTDEEQKTIVDFLHTRRAEGGDQGTFKDVTWNALVDHLHVTHPTLPAKDINQVKGKWKTVCPTLLSHSNTYSINVPVDEDSLDSDMRLPRPLRAALGPYSGGEYTGSECRGHMDD